MSCTAGNLLDMGSTIVDLDELSFRRIGLQGRVHVSKLETQSRKQSDIPRDSSR
jgi:hypothetical protein